MSTAKILFVQQDAYSYAKTTISTPEPLCLPVYIYSREAFGTFDFRVFIV